VNHADRDRVRQRMAERFGAALIQLSSAELIEREGVLRQVVGLTLEATGLRQPLGGRCRVRTGDGRGLDSEIVGFAGERTYLMPSGSVHGLVPGASVIRDRRKAAVEVGDALLGRVIDGEGQPLDGRPPPLAQQRVPLAAVPRNPLACEPIRVPLDVGVRAINALFTVGRGQRLGLFAGSGVGKSTLLGMMTRYTGADVVVVGLVGERGREVRDFVERTLGEDGLRRAVVVAAPADHPPLARLHAALRASAIAEHFRDQGKHVLLLMDSLTRFAQAQREIGLSVGEPPATRGYPPSVFARLPQLVERAGNGAPGQGSITAFYTVLTEGDDPNDPVADSARAILDGHILLSRAVAESGRYPAVDVEASISRAAHDLQTPPQRAQARRFRQLYSAYQSHRDLIAIGAYQKGADPRVDQALELWPRLTEFLHQDAHEAAGYADSLSALATLLPG
jgi:flagellum-specific ATP synthase